MNKRKLKVYSSKVAFLLTLNKMSNTFSSSDYFLLLLFEDRL